MPIRWRYEARRSKISSAVLVQVKGLGLSFHAAIQWRRPAWRHEHRGAAGAALVRMRDRGETISVIAALAETTESEVRGLPKLASATRRGRPRGVVRGGRWLVVRRGRRPP